MLIKRNFIINASPRIVLFEEEDTLSDLLRRIGLKSVKIGCGAGQCGTCSVLLNGEVVRSCIIKVKNIKEGSAIETLEGLGSAESLHPLQQAFITYGAVQCGFCTPGFLMSAKALLQNNPDPTRAEVRAWFEKHRNICRCTGYKPIVDAVIAAAAVMRGDAKPEDIVFHYEKGDDIYGSNFPRPSALPKVLGTSEFGEDFSERMPDGTIHLAIVQAKVHHANIISLDFSEAEKMPGVVKIITASDVKGTNRLRLLPTPGSAEYQSDGLDHPVICDKKIFRYGDVVAVVAARTRKEARAAAAKVKINFEPLPAYLTFPDAAAEDAVRIHENSPNVYIEQPLFKGEETPALFETAAYSVEGAFSTVREPHLPLEPDNAQAYWGENGMMVVHCKNQNLYGSISNFAEAIGLPKNKIRMVQNESGGSFGYSLSAQMPALAAACAMALDAPVSLVLSYPEHQHFTGKRAASYTNARLACDSSGRITALEFHSGLDHGAYSDVSLSLASKSVRFFGIPYNIPNIRGLSRICFSNGNFGVAYRAFASPQAFTVGESLVDMLAVKAGIDPFEFRYINAAVEGDLTPNSTSYRHYPMRKMLDMMRPYYKEWKEEAKSKNTSDKKYGVGIGFGGYHVGKPNDSAQAALELNEDGSVTHYCTWEDVGQGGDIGALTHTLTYLRELNLTPDRVHLVQNDTYTCPNGGSASASRSHHMVGMATKIAAEALIDAMRKPDGTYRSYDEMTAEGIPVKYFGKYNSPSDISSIDKYTGHGLGCVGQNFILNLAEVEVDVKSGKVKVLRFRIISDIGVVGNKLNVTGLALGGMSHSIGFALTEDYDDTRRCETMTGAGIPTIEDIPDDAEVIFSETPREYGPHGSTGCAESYQSCGHTAVLNAIYDAVGVRIYSLPATPEKIKRGMEALSRGEEIKEKPWNLGCDMYERLEYFREKAKGRV